LPKERTTIGGKGGSYRLHKSLEGRPLLPEEMGGKKKRIVLFEDLWRGKAENPPFLGGGKRVPPHRIKNQYNVQGGKEIHKNVGGGKKSHLIFASALTFYFWGGKGKSWDSFSSLRAKAKYTGEKKKKAEGF